MDNQALQTLLSEILPDTEIIQGGQFVEINLDPTRLHEVLTILKNNDQCCFNLLFCETGIDLNGKLGVVYHLRSIELGHSCVCRVFTESRENPVLDSAADLWSAALFYDREIFDLFGIKFNNHPDLRRLFLEDDFVGHPLRKDFEDPINIIRK
jgi:NADH-quinone oxidoreductase subunit C